MGDGFFGFNVALRGLYASQKKLDIANHNLSNVNTPGYSRQEGIQTATRPLFSYDGTGMIGTGADVVGVERIRDEYLDFKYWSENVNYGEWDVKRQQLEELELVYNGLSDSGFSNITNDFFSSLQELSKDPSSSAVRSLVRERGVTLTKYFNSVASKFENMQMDVNYKVNATVLEANSIGTQVVQLNRQIYTSELDGSLANDLRDQRGLLIDKLSKLVNIDASEVQTGTLPSGRPEKKMLITISGKAFVEHYSLSELSSEPRDTKLNEEDIPNLYTVGWKDGNSLNIKGGELKGYMDIRDGNEGENGSPAYKGVPFYLKKMNDFVRTFAMAFNEGFIDKDADGSISNLEDGVGHVDGYGIDMDGDGPRGTPGQIRFFTYKGDDGKEQNSSEFVDGVTQRDDIMAKYKNMTAANFSLSEEILGHLDSISVASVPDVWGNTDVVESLLELRHDSHMFAEGAPEDFMNSVIATLGIDSQQADRISNNQDIIIKQIENRRISNSGVSIDEEMANVIKHQHAYTAASQMINTFKEIYDILINRLGV